MNLKKFSNNFEFVVYISTTQFFAKEKQTNVESGNSTESKDPGDSGVSGDPGKSGESAHFG